MSNNALFSPAPGYYKLILPLGLLALWQFAAWQGLVDSRLLPSPEVVVARFWKELISGELLINVAWSLGRDLFGFALGSLLGVGVGLLLGLSRVFRIFVGPTFNAFKQIAIFAWIPLISVWFGTNELAKIVFITLGTFAPVVVNTWEGAANISKLHIEAARVLGFNRWQFLRLLALPSAMPAILTGLYLGLFYSWLATIGAEYFTNVAPGVGGMIVAGRVDFDMPLVMVGVALLGIIGYTLNTISQLLRLRVLHWQR